MVTTVPNVEGIVAQGAAAVFVLGSYLAGEPCVRRPQRRGEVPATVPTHEPVAAGDSAESRIPVLATT